MRHDYVFDQCVCISQDLRKKKMIDDYVVKEVDDKPKDYILVSLIKKGRKLEMRVNKNARPDQVDKMMCDLFNELINLIKFEESLEPDRPKTVYEQTVDICKAYLRIGLIDRWEIEEENENGALWVTLYIGKRGVKWWIGQLASPLTIKETIHNLVDEVREIVNMDKSVFKCKEQVDYNNFTSKRTKFVKIVKEHCPKLQDVMDYSGYGFDTDTFKMYRIEDEYFITNKETLLTVNWYKNLGRCWQSSLPNDYENWEYELVLFFTMLSREIEELEPHQKEGRYEYKS